MSRLLEIGADPSKLYEQFRRQEETRLSQQEQIQRQAQHRLTSQARTVREYRLAREAEQHLLAEPYIDLADMTYSDYRKTREAQQSGKIPFSYAEYAQMTGQPVEREEPEAKPAEREDVDLMAYREERGKDLL